MPEHSFLLRHKTPEPSAKPDPAHMQNWLESLRDGCGKMVAWRLAWSGGVVLGVLVLVAGWQARARMPESGGRVLWGLSVAGAGCVMVALLCMHCRLLHDLTFPRPGHTGPDSDWGFWNKMSGASLLPGAVSVGMIALGALVFLATQALPALEKAFGVMPAWLLSVGLTTAILGIAWSDFAHFRFLGLWARFLQSPKLTQHAEWLVFLNYLSLGLWGALVCVSYSVYQDYQLPQGTTGFEPSWMLNCVCLALYLPARLGVQVMACLAYSEARRGFADLAADAPGPCRA